MYNYILIPSFGPIGPRPCRKRCFDDFSNNYDISGMAEAIFAHRVAKER